MASPAHDVEAHAAPVDDTAGDPASSSVAPLSPRHASGPPRDQDWAESGFQRTSSSRRRKPAGQGHNRTSSEYANTSPIAAPLASVAPEAPEPPPAPRGPPISYRDPHTNGGLNAKSFADRARDLADEGTHIPTGRTPEPKADMAFKEGHTPFIQAIRPEVVHAEREEIYEDENVDETAPAPAPLQQKLPQQQQQPARMPFAEHSSQNKGVPQIYQGVNVGDETKPRRESIRGKANPQKIDWAVDHSPLQRLEVKLNDLSKEEKRARVQAAEQRAREREKARKERESQDLDDTGPRAVDSGRKRDSTRSRAAPQDQEDIVSTRAQPGRRAVSDPHAAAANQTTPRSGQQRTSRIPRPVEAAAAAGVVGAAATGLGRSQSQSQRQRASLDSAGPRMAEDSNPLTRHYNGSRPIGGTDRRRSTDDREVRFHPFDESINRNKTGSKAPRTDLPPQQAALYAERVTVNDEPAPAHAHLAQKGGSKYVDPPQAPAAGKARQLLGFGGEQAQDQTQQPGATGHHRFMPHLHRHQQSASGPTAPQPSRHLDEWRQGGTARLMLSDLHARKESAKDASRTNDKNLPWWESPTTSQRRSSRSSSQQRPEVEYFDGANEDPNQPISFDPPLYMKCGPLLRYTGMKRDKLAPPAGKPAYERETWRGSVMIVTVDSHSEYEPAPTLRLFHQPMELLPPPPTHVTEGDEALPSEYVDPVAGMPKIARDGSAVYVKPAEDFEEGHDYSRDETDDGLYEKERTAVVPTGYGRPDDDGGDSPVEQVSSPSRRGKSKGRFREVKGIRLHAERGVTFWRFNLEVELGDKQARIAYRINKGTSVGFWVPARGQSMNIMFHSCNGFSHSVKPEEFGGPDPLWRDVLNAHQTKPFHVMIGGGDQIYNDRVMDDTVIFKDWLETKNPHHKHEAPFTPEMCDELEQFYLDRYAMWFSQGFFGMANSQIPMVNIWDDHDIIDGFGSYSHHFMESPVFCGLGSVAFKYYMLFQHQSVPDELEADEPSWLLGPSPGPYINFPSRSLFMSFGKSVSFLGIDCRTERMRDEILSQHTYDKIFDRCHREIIHGETKHLIVLLGVPIAYPRLEWLENILTSRAADPLKALAKLGLMGNLMNKFDGSYEILDDLDDHWTAKHHKEERRWLIEELQALAAEKSVRITILGGDVHLAAIGQFFSNKKLGIPKDQDYRYMPNIISSAIVNTPPSDMMADFINRRDKKIHHLDDNTDEDMIPMFTHDVDGKKRNNKKLLPRRNWCSISEYQPGTTPPPSPPLTPSGPQTPASPWSEEQGPRRSFSLGNSRPAQLLRRLSLSNREGRDRDELDPSLPYSQQRPLGDDPANDSYFPPASGNARTFNKPQRSSSGPPIPTRPTSQFHRRPTNLSEMAVKKGGLPDAGGEISLESGLDIRLNCEFKQGDPVGSTESYRLLVPALWHTGGSWAPAPERRPSMIKRLSSLKANPFAAKNKAVDDYSDESDAEREPPAQFQPRSQFQSRPQDPEPAMVAAPVTLETPAAPLPATTSATRGVPTANGAGNAYSADDRRPMGYSVSVESLPQRPRRQSLLQRFGSLKDKIPQLNRQKHVDDNYSEYTNDEYAPNDDAAMMGQASMARQSRPPVTGSVDSVSRKPRRPSIAQRFGSIGRRLSQMGRKKDREEYYSDTGSYTGSETGGDTDHESDFLGSGDLSRPGRQPPLASPPGSKSQPMVTPPGSRGQPFAPPPAARAQPAVSQSSQKQQQPPQSQRSQQQPPPPPQQAQRQSQKLQKPQAYKPTAPAGFPTRTSSQRDPPPKQEDEIPDPFKARPKLAMSPPPQMQQAQFVAPAQPQYASTYGGSTDAMVGNRQSVTNAPPTNATAPRASSKRNSTRQAQDNRRSGGIYVPPPPPPQPASPAQASDDADSAEESSELDSIDDLDSIKGAAKARNKARRSKDLTGVLGPGARAKAQQQAEKQLEQERLMAQAQAQVQAARSQSVRAPPGAAPRRKDISKFFGEDDPAEEQGMRRRVTDPGSGKRGSGGYSGVEAWNGSRKWWKLGK